MNSRLTDIKNDVVDAVDMLETRMVDLEREINKVEAELERTRTVLEALRKDPYEFWVCASWRGTRAHPEMRITSFALFKDADDWQTQELRDGALHTTAERQTMPQHPDVKRMKELLREAIDLLPDDVDHQSYKEMEFIEKAEEMLKDG